MLEVVLELASEDAPEALAKMQLAPAIWSAAGQCSVRAASFDFVPPLPGCHPATRACCVVLIHQAQRVDMDLLTFSLGILEQGPEPGFECLGPWQTHVPLLPNAAAGELRAPSGAALVPIVSGALGRTLLPAAIAPPGILADLLVAHGGKADADLRRLEESPGPGLAQVARGLRSKLRWAQWAARNPGIATAAQGLKSLVTLSRTGAHLVASFLRDLHPLDSSCSPLVLPQRCRVPPAAAGPPGLPLPLEPRHRKRPGQCLQPTERGAHERRVGPPPGSGHHSDHPPHSAVDLATRGARRWLLGVLG